VTIERVHWLTGYDDATRLRLFTLGEAEVCTVEDAGNLRTARREFPRALHSSKEASMGWLGLNVGRGRMADPRLRRALSLLIDRGLLVGPVRGLGEQPSDAMLPPGLPGYPKPALPDYASWPMSQRVAAARDLLRQAGITPETLPPLVVGYAVSPTLRKVFLAIAAMWKSIGIRTELQPYDGRAYNVALNEGRFDVFGYASFAQLPSPVVFLDRFLAESPMNFSRWRSAEYDRVLQAALRETTDTRRAAGFNAAERILLRELPVVPLWIGGSNHLVSDGVQGWVDHPGHAHPSQYLSWRAT
jgi:oligopeptide transport system substrate-binding protein